jgi:hypothetical protein
VARPRARRKYGPLAGVTRSKSSRYGSCGGGVTRSGAPGGGRRSRNDGSAASVRGASTVVAKVTAPTGSSSVATPPGCRRRRPSRRPFWERNSSTPFRLGTQTKRLPHGCFRPWSSRFRSSVRIVCGVVPSASAASSTVRSSGIATDGRATRAIRHHHQHPSSTQAALSYPVPVGWYEGSGRLETF